mmetsp:Transcript_40409/g.65524  ORF Transcript_40409/g.65524 Transcript_40409/m.65524 type:complete len:273 (-) Transcript_40409:2948-3766(-)
MVSKSRIEPVQRPIARFNRKLGFTQGSGHSASQSLKLARGIGNDKGSTRVRLCLHKGTNHLRLVCTKSDTGNVDIRVLHCKHAQILLLPSLTGLCKQLDSSGRSGLGALSTSVAVHLRVKYQDVHLLPTGKNVIKTSIADIVGPTVATNDELSNLGEEVFLSIELRNGGMLILLTDQQPLNTFRNSTAFGGVILQLEPLVEILAQGRGQRNGGVLHNTLNVRLQGLPSSNSRHPNAIAELGVVFEQGVGPGRTTTLCVGGVGVGRRGSTPNG